MELAELKCAVCAVYTAATQTELDKEKRDVLCLKAFMTEPLNSLVRIPGDMEPLVNELIIVCCKNLKCFLSAAAQIYPRESSQFPFEKLMHEQYYEVCLKKMQQVGLPTFMDFENACSVYKGIHISKMGSARSVVRRFASEIDPCAEMDQFLAKIDTFRDVRDIVASAMIEKNDPYEVWEHIQPAFRDGYKSFNQWFYAEKTKALIEMLISMEATPENIRITVEWIKILNGAYIDPLGGEKWFKGESRRAEWQQRNNVEL